MWNLQSIEARNICSFTKLQFFMKQNVATLIFGNNEDDGENQQHNGSGKSAFMECIGFGITGEAFRKVDTIEDIIRDDEDYAEVKLDLYNQESEKRMIVSRRIERGQSQKVEVTIVENDEPSYIPFVSVIETNRQILEILGISKDDLYHNYLLNANRFKSFFNSSDKEKKEIINTFSNGIIVDEAIEKLKVDIEAAGEEADKANLEVSRVTGAIEAIQSQIDEAENNAEAMESQRKEKVDALKSKIASEREQIRSIQKEIDDAHDDATKLNNAAIKIESIEDAGLDLTTLNHQVKKVLTEVGFESKMTDWNLRIQSLNEKKEKDSQLVSELNAELTGIQAKLNESKRQLEEAGAEYNKVKESNHQKDEADQKEILEIQEDIKKYEEKSKKILNDIIATNEQIANARHDIVKLTAAINGAVECPNCHHKFALDSNLSVDELKVELDQKDASVKNMEEDVESYRSKKSKNDEEIENCRLDMQDIRDDIQKRSNALSELFNKGQAFRHSYNGNKEEFDKLEERINSLKSSISNAENEIAKLSESIVTEALDILDGQIDELERTQKTKKAQIEGCKSAIEVNEASIKELESATVSDHVDKLRATLESKESEKKEVDAVFREKQAALNELKEQEVRFVNFKTHLANTKINSISQITNQVLQDIKSPIRVHLSGFTVTKSGKVRDKISVSVSKNGIDCGSFLKCSAGEKARIMFANIVAMQRMTNLTAIGGGLNLICIDEIMDNCEEAGLMSVAEMANELGITVLMITQGKTSENYPYELVVTKRCGVSFVSKHPKSDEDA